MKVTKELSNKIERVVNEKYNLLVSESSSIYSEEYQKEKDKLCNAVYEMAKNDEILYRYFMTNIYGVRNDKTLMDAIRSHTREDAVLETSPRKEELYKLRNAKKELYNERDLLIEDLKIQISYAGDLNRIKEIFETVGLQF